MKNAKTSTAARTKAKAKGSRHGKHAPDSVIIGAFVTPEFKALTQIVANKIGCEVSELLLDGVRYHATKVGVMKDGRINPEYELEIKVVAARLRENKKARQRKEKANDYVLSQSWGWNSVSAGTEGHPLPLDATDDHLDALHHPV